MSKVDTSKFVDRLIHDYNVVEFVGVSDSTLKYLINEVTNRHMYKSFTNEGDAVAYAAGRTMSGHNTVVLMQNSGLTNASSPISSLTSLYKIPLMYIVGWRGKPLTKDEPQHRIIGAKTKEFITSITENDISFATINEEDYSLDFTDNDYFRFNQVFVLVDPDTFTETSLSSNHVSDYGCNREDCIWAIKEVVDNDTYILSTTGFTSRELMSLGEDDRHNFYMLGSMGCLISFALGVAQSYPDKKFVVLDGDGSFLMRPEGAYLCDTFNIFNNIYHIIFNNGCHLSTGGQKIPTDQISSLLEKRSSRVIKSYDSESLVSDLKSWILDSRRITCHNIVETSTEVSEGLPRPTVPPEDILRNFQRGLLEI